MKRLPYSVLGRVGGLGVLAAAIVTSPVFAQEKPAKGGGEQQTTAVQTAITLATADPMVSGGFHAQFSRHGDGLVRT